MNVKPSKFEIILFYLVPKHTFDLLLVVKNLKVDILLARILKSFQAEQNADMLFRGTVYVPILYKTQSWCFRMNQILRLNWFPF